MLQFIRSGIGSIFVKALFVLLIASFAVWGIGDIFYGNRAGETAIEIGDVEITTVEVLQEFDRQRQQTGIQISAEDAARFGFLDRSIEQLVNAGLFTAEANTLGLTAGTEVLRQAIVDTPAFRDELGQFSPFRFQQILSRVGMTEQMYVELLRNDVTRGQIVSAAANGTTAPKVLTDTLFKYRNERRTAKVVTITADSVGDVEVPDDAALAAFYDERKEDYEIPESRAVTYLPLSIQTIADRMEIAEEDIAEEYEAGGDRWRTAERRAVRQMVFDDQATADAAVERIREGEDFAAVAQDALALGADDLSLGEITRADLPDAALGDAVFAADEGAVTDPIESAFGWHVLSVDGITAETVRPLEEVKDAVRMELALDRAFEEVSELSVQLEDLLAGGSTIEEAGKSLNIATTTVAELDRQGLDRSGSPVAGLPTGQAFLGAVLDLPEGEPSEILETADEGFVVVRVDKITPAEIPALDAVRERAVADWTADRKRQLAGEQAEALLAAADAAGSLESAVSALGLAVIPEGPFTRAGSGLAEGRPRSLPEVAFELSSGQRGLAESDNAVAVIELVEVLAADPIADAPARTQLASSLGADIDSDLFSGLLESLRGAYPVSVDRAIVEQVLQSQTAMQGHMQ